VGKLSELRAHFAFFLNSDACLRQEDVDSDYLFANSSRSFQMSDPAKVVQTLLATIFVGI
jgi:hypothetical protein